MLICLDMDGVLIQSRATHLNALNQALSEFGIHDIKNIEHLQDEMPTRYKIARMGVPSELHDAIDARKQELTLQALSELPRNEELVALIVRLQSEGHAVVVCSNARRDTIRIVQQRLGIDVPYYGNEDVLRPKPNPEIFLRAMLNAGVGPRDTIIVEDSPTGRTAAEQSGARVVPVISPADVTYERIMSSSIPAATSKWQATMNVLIPMAGAGSRFVDQGYTFIKPLIEVKGQPMIQAVVDNLGVEAHFIFVCQREHVVRYNLRQLLNLIAPGCDIIETDGLTKGAACSALLAEHLINNDTPLLISNADEVMDWDPTAFYWWTENSNADGCLLTFTSTHPKWSFIRLENDRVVEVAEKRPISNQATCGVYWWRHGSRFVESAQSMIDDGFQTNGEFYIAPVYNHAIAAGAYITAWPVERMWGLGTPEDLQAFLDR